MKKAVIISKFVLFLLVFWLLFSTVRAVYNISKLITQDRKLFSLSDEQRKREVYGDISIMVKQISRITNGDPILLTGNDGGLYFFLRYLLYPQKIYWVNNITNTEAKTQPWRYVFYPYKSLQNEKRTYVTVRDPVTGEILGRIVELQ